MVACSRCSDIFLREFFSCALLSERLEQASKRGDYDITKTVGAF